MMRALILAGLTSLIVGITTSGSLHAQAVTPPTATDPLIPVTKAEDADVGPLAMITILTSDMAASRRFYQGSMDMDVRMRRVTNWQARDLARAYGVPEQSQFNVAVFSRPNVPDAAKIRIIEVTSPVPLARPNHDAQIIGPLSLGFPVHQIETRAQRLAVAGTPATAGVTLLLLKRNDGTPYDVKETHFKGPDGVLSLAIDRADMRPVGPIDPILNIGGPAYSGMIVSDAAATARFLSEVLGFEKRRDVVLASSGPNGGLGLPAGTRFVFQQWFAPGATTGYLVVMDYETAGKAAAQPLGHGAVAAPFLGRGALGIRRLSFSTPNLNNVMTRARANNTPILQTPRTSVEFGLGRVRTAVIVTPDGLPIEVFEPIASQSVTPSPQASRP